MLGGKAGWRPEHPNPRTLSRCTHPRPRPLALPTVVLLPVLPPVGVAPAVAQRARGAFASLAVRAVITHDTPRSAPSVHSSHQCTQALLRRLGGRTCCGCRCLIRSRRLGRWNGRAHSALVHERARATPQSCMQVGRCPHQSHPINACVPHVRHHQPLFETPLSRPLRLPLHARGRGRLGECSERSTRGCRPVIPGRNKGCEPKQ
jgi:hypothetical protein